MLPREKSNTTGGCDADESSRMLRSMSAHTPVVVVSDSHLAPVRPEVTSRFHRFLEAVPDLGSHLVINGDLFEFWFEYRAVIPRAAFGTLAALAAVRRAGIDLTLLGGNHDRWGGAFWREEFDAAYHEDSVELELAGWPALVAHGDGVGEDSRAGRFLHRVVRHPITIGTFRRVHPDFGLSLVDRFSGLLAARKGDTDLIARSVASQAAYARHLLGSRPELSLVIMGHTHRPALEQVADRRWYVNPGAWVEGYRYAVISEGGPELHSFD